MNVLDTIWVSPCLYNISKMKRKEGNAWLQLLCLIPFLHKLFLNAWNKYIRILQPFTKVNMQNDNFLEHSIKHYPLILSGLPHHGNTAITLKSIVSKKKKGSQLFSGVFRNLDKIILSAFPSRIIWFTLTQPWWKGIKVPIQLQFLEDYGDTWKYSGNLWKRLWLWP